MQFSVRVFRSLLVVALVLAFVGRTNAGFLTGFSGNTKAENTGLTAKITKNFAVLDRLTGTSTPGDVFGTGQAGFDASMIAGAGSGALDTSARYLYLYQDVASPASLAVFVGDSLSSQGTPLGITSYGEWRLHLADDGGIVSTTNDFGPDGIAFSTRRTGKYWRHKPKYLIVPSDHRLSPSHSFREFNVLLAAVFARSGRGRTSCWLYVELRSAVVVIQQRIELFRRRTSGSGPRAVLDCASLRGRPRADRLRRLSRTWPLASDKWLG